MNIRPLSLYLSLLAFLGPALSASQVSSFPIDTANLAERICDEDPAAETKLQCHVIVKNFGRELTATAPGSSLRLVSGGPVVTHCGLWNATLTLDPVRLRSVSRGLEMSARLRFASQETGQTVDFTLHPGRGAGRWSLVRAGRSLHLTGESEVEEVLTFDDCIPSWVYDSPQYEVIPEEKCEVCPEEETPSDDEVGDGDTSQTAPVEHEP